MDWNNIASFIVQYCSKILEAVGTPESVQHAFKECRKAIATALHPTNPNLRSIAETAVGNLYFALFPDVCPPPETELAQQAGSRLSGFSKNCEKSDPSGGLQTNATAACEVLPQSQGESDDPTSSRPKCEAGHNISLRDETHTTDGMINEAGGSTDSADVPTTSAAEAHVDNTAVLGIRECDFTSRSLIVREHGTGRFGPVNLIRMEIGDEWKLFAAKYYEYVDEFEKKEIEFGRVLSAFNAVRHPCLTTVLYYQKPARGSGPIIATEYFDFGSLDSLLNDVRGGKRVEIWTPTARVLVVCGIVCGLLSLHSHDLFHGSLKPTDIFLDSEFNVYLSDYLSFSFERCGLAFSSLVGSPIYSAPELYTLGDASFDINNSDDTLRFMPIDVYTVGLICYEILSGVTAFSSKLTAAQLRTMTMNNQERPQIPSIIKPDFGKLIARCWDSDPSNRPAMRDIWGTLSQMNFQIIDGVDSDFVRARIASFF
jgi:serine/threonine protein kinase